MIAKKTPNTRNLRPRKHDWASALLSLSESQLDGLKKREAMVRAAQHVLGRLGMPATMVALDAHMPKILAQAAVYRDGDEGREPGRADAMARTCSARNLLRWITLYREHGPIGLVDGRSRVGLVDRSVGKAARMPSLTNASQPGWEYLTGEEIFHVPERIVIEVAIDRHGLIHEWHICHPPGIFHGDRAIELDHSRFPTSKSQG